MRRAGADPVRAAVPLDFGRSAILVVRRLLKIDFAQNALIDRRNCDAACSRRTSETSGRWRRNWMKPKKETFKGGAFWGWTFIPTRMSEVRG
jgi:hypothetical protein